MKRNRRSGLQETPPSGKAGFFARALPIAAVVLGLSLTAPAFAGEGGGSEKQGKYLFRAKCKECHWPDKEGGDVTPMTFTQDQWKGFFEKDKHKRKKDVWSEMFTQEELLHIRTYLIEHAADSPQPETCG